MKKTGLITDLQRFSLHDGPGIRTTVFFKGCPLHCAWCHNPECISPKKQLLLYPEKCIGCGKCDEGCFSGARTECGTEYTPQELLEALLADQSYYGKNGGVTFSGGEPLMQRDFLLEMIPLCKQEGLHTAVETSLILWDEAILSAVDLVMADFKIWDCNLHRTYTGVGNETIPEHFRRLNELGIPTVASTPVIPEIDQGIPEISQFLKGLDSVREYRLLPYHPLGLEKAKACGIEMRAFSVPDEATWKRVSQYAFIR
ncbi:MAG: radical SAM protein [Clostridia bacterium]|nr:radical SAM protein [Clostridia bacterium]